MIDRLWMDIPSSPMQFVRGYAQLPGWSVWDLLRHHSVAALGRRVVRQTRRVLEHGRLIERI
jgi:hypothetical protein